MLADKPVHAAVLQAFAMTPSVLPLRLQPAGLDHDPRAAAGRNTLDDDDVTVLSLLEPAGAEKAYLLGPDYESRKHELENVANPLTENILDHWTTVQQIRGEIDITQKTLS